MNQNNRRLIEIKDEKRIYIALLNKTESISDCATYQSRLDKLEKEEQEILKRGDTYDFIH